MCSYEIFLSRRTCKHSYSSHNLSKQGSASLQLQHRMNKNRALSRVSKVESRSGGVKGSWGLGWGSRESECKPSSCYSSFLCPGLVALPTVPRLLGSSKCCKQCSQKL